MATKPIRNLNVNSKGAFTGEVSANMIKDFGAQHVIVGHSERRSLYGESSAVVADSVLADRVTAATGLSEPEQAIC